MPARIQGPATGALEIQAGTGQQITFITDGEGSINLSALSTQVYTDNAVNTAITNLIGGAPAALDTLNELAAAIADDANYAATITTQLANKAEDTDIIANVSATVVKVSTDDIDTDLTTSGVYGWNSASIPINAPAGLSNAVLLQDTNGSDFTQIAFGGTNNDAAYVRVAAGAGWNPWYKLVGNGDTVTLTGEVTGSANFDANGDVSIATTLFKAAPASSVGAPGDAAGDVAISSTHLYYCIAAYDGTSDIWVRAAFTGGAW